MSDLYTGDCIEVMRSLDADTVVDSIVTDPPYELGFMGKHWDATNIANNAEVWAECLRVLKPGGHLLAFGGTRTYHRMTCAIEDAGFEIRDCVIWLYGSGFPKSLDVSKAIDKAAGAVQEVIGVGPFASRHPHADHERQGITFADDSCVRPAGHTITAPATDAARQWQGWGTALKPAHEPIVVARKPLIGTVAANVLQFGTGAINVDECRIALEGVQAHWEKYNPSGKIGFGGGEGKRSGPAYNTLGRWPANVIHDGSAEVLAEFPNAGSAARFFYCAKASKSDRGECNFHPTVKPIALMRYLCRLVTPPGGVILDPFMGSGSTGKAADLEGFKFIGIDQSAEYVEIARARINAHRQLALA